MTKEQLKNILIENKCIAPDEWDNENPFVGIDLDVLYDIFEKEKQLWINKAWNWLTSQKGERTIDDFKQAMIEE